MNAQTFITLAVVFLALAIILAAVAIVLYRRFDIPAVRDALSGRAAKREIEALRGTRAGQWEHMEDPAARGNRRPRGGKPAQASTTGSGSDIEFRHGTTGSVNASGTGQTGTGGSSRSTDAGATRRAGAETTVTAGARAAVAHAQDAPGTTKAPAEPVVEIPVAIASAAELADEGETSLMQFRKPEENDSDEDESRTILVHAGRHAATSGQSGPRAAGGDADRNAGTAGKSANKGAGKGANTTAGRAKGTGAAKNANVKSNEDNR